MQEYQTITSELVRNAKGVVGAADILKTAVAGGDRSDISFAAEVLAKAADRYAGTTDAQARFGFDQMAATPEQSTLSRERLSGDLLAGALMDLEVANTLFAAGQHAGETGAPVAAEELESASEALSRLTQEMALPLGKPLEASRRFGFSEAAVQEAPVASADLATARKKFEERVSALYDDLVARSRGVFDAAFKGIKDLDEKKVAELIGKIGGAAMELPAIGKLIAAGLKLAAQAFSKFTQMLGGVGVAALQEKTREALQSVIDGGSLVEKFLRYSYGAKAGTERVRTLLDQTTADVAKLDAGNRRLMDLGVRFAEEMVLVTRIVDGLTTGKRFASFFLPEATTISFFGGFYLIAMSYAVFVGMDFADSANLLNFVEGAMQLAESTLA